MDFSTLLPKLLGLAWLLPLASFALIVFWGRRMGNGGKCAGYLATLAIGCSTVLSFAALIDWIGHNPLPSPHEAAQHAARCRQPRSAAIGTSWAASARCN